MSLYDRLRTALEQFYERQEDRLDVWPDVDDLCQEPVPYALTEKAA